MGKEKKSSNEKIFAGIAAQCRKILVSREPEDQAYKALAKDIIKAIANSK